MSNMIQEMLQEHYKLFENPVTKLGELHYKILETELNVEKKKRADKQFEKEIGYDEIHWWVFLKEKNIIELKNKTEKILKSAQKLKEDSDILTKTSFPKKYSEVIDNLKNFCISHESEIQDLLDYTNWLISKNPMAAIMLFNYRVWGSTRMGDRKIRLDVKDKQSTIYSCIEIALGLRQSFHSPTLVRQYIDVDYDLYEKMQHEDYTTHVEIPWETVVGRASNEIHSEMSDYFRGLRDSCRHILMEIDEYEKSIHILHDDNFWKLFVKKAMTIPIEKMLWDFKETLPIWQKDNISKKKKRQKVCEDIASFANKEGGVLIIGVTNDMPRKIVGLEDLENKVKHIKDIIQEGISYERDLTHFQILTFEEEKKICLLIIIKSAMQMVGVKMKKSMKPIESIGGTIITSYYPVRNETGIMNLPERNLWQAKAGQKHDSFEFVTTLYTNYSGKK